MADMESVPRQSVSGPNTHQTQAVKEVVGTLSCCWCPRWMSSDTRLWGPTVPAAKTDFLFSSVGWVFMIDKLIDEIGT